MKVYLTEDEMFPVFDADTDKSFGVEVELPDEVWERWLKVNEEWLALQSQMETAYKEARRKRLNKSSL